MNDIVMESGSLRSTGSLKELLRRWGKVLERDGNRVAQHVRCLLWHQFLVAPIGMALWFPSRNP